MRILVIPASDWLAHPLSSRLHFIFERLAKHHEVHVMRYVIPLWKRKRRSNAILHEVRGLPIRDLSLYYTFNAVSHQLLLNKILKTHRIDVIIFSNILTGVESVIAGKKYKIPVVCDYLDHFPESASSYYDNPVAKTLVKKVVGEVTQWSLIRANHVVTVSTRFFDWLRERGVPNVSIIPNGVELDVFKPIDKNGAREQLGIKELNEKFVIGYIGSAGNWVDLEVVSAATNMLNHAGVSTAFLVVGSSIAGHYSRSFRNLGSNVFQVGFVNYKRVPLYINACDVCVLPLKNMAKNLTRPLKLLEYFACAKPVLSLPNLEIEKEFGDAVTFFRDCEEMTRIMLKFAQKPEEYSSKIRRGLRYTEENSWDKHARSYEQLLHRIVEGSK